ncbi:MAG: hypothetical protein U0996_01350 [Planctomycetaceae bacterium]
MANEKCMVPIFTATDPAEKPTEKKTTRVSTRLISVEANDVRDNAEKRNPIFALGALVVLRFWACWACSDNLQQQSQRTN